MHLRRQPQAIAGHAALAGARLRRARARPAAGAAPARRAARARGRGRAAAGRSTCRARRRTRPRRRRETPGSSPRPSPAARCPTASTSGAAVGLGISTQSVDRSVECGFVRSCSATPAGDVDHQEHDDPDRVDKVPVPGDQRARRCDVAGVICAAQRKAEHDQHRDHADRDVQAMEADQRVVRRAEQIAADRELMLGDQLAPFDAGAARETRCPARSSPPATGRRCRGSPRSSARSAAWITTLLESRQSVVTITSGSDSASAGVGPTTSWPMNAT